jgi:hypothetical protein
MIVEKACWERGCACYDHRVDEGVKVTLVQREWVGLTEDEYEAIRTAGGFGKGSLRFKSIFEAIETQLKEKNT